MAEASGQENARKRYETLCFLELYYTTQWPFNSTGKQDTDLSMHKY